MSSRGLPRPVNQRGLPIPYISDPNDLGSMDLTALKEVILKHACQVCGIKLEAEEVVYAVEYMLNQPGFLEGSTPMHEACYRLALKHCPAFRRYDYDEVVGPAKAFGNQSTIHPELTTTTWREPTKLKGEVK